MKLTRLFLSQALSQPDYRSPKGLLRRAGEIAVAFTAITFFSSTSFAAPVELGANNISVEQNRWVNYQLELPVNARDINVAIRDGRGDADLYLSFGSRPSLSSYDCRPYRTGNEETCLFDVALDTQLFISLYGYEAASGVTITVSYDDGENGSGDDDQQGSYQWEGLDDYYGDLDSLSSLALKRELNAAAQRGHRRLSYSAVWDALRITDEDPQNSDRVILLYTGRSQAKSFNASGNNDPDAWNREHSWPKSRGFPKQSQWAYTDIHHLRPADASVNSTRGSKDYGEGGSEISEAPGNFTSSASFEPRDAVKGDLARMMFYMAVRYDGNDGTNTGDLELRRGSSSGGPELGNLCILLDWHSNDPVSQLEIDRHQRIVAEQGNRNPFIDNPAWANRIWEGGCP